MKKDKEARILLQLSRTLGQLDKDTRLMILWIHLKKLLKGNKENLDWLLKQINKHISEEN